jgi:hypothetical protein
MISCRYLTVYFSQTMPAKGGVIHPEVERILRDQGSLIGVRHYESFPLSSRYRRAAQQAPSSAPLSRAGPSAAQAPP